MKRILPLILAMVAIVAVSGCIDTGNTGGTQTTTGNGLEITDFSSDRSEVFTNQGVRVFMEVENLGQSEVAEGFMYLIGNIEEVDAYNKEEGSNYWRTEDSRVMTFDELKPADTLREIPAEKERVDWKLYAPTLAAGQQRTDSFEGRAYYSFETKASGTLWLYSPTEAEAARNSGEALDKSQISSSVGPIEITVEVAPDPPEIESGDNEFALQITLTNVGEGTVFYQEDFDYTSEPSLVSDDLNKIKITSDTSDLVITGCNEIEDGDLAELIGTATTIYCDAEYPLGKVDAYCKKTKEQVEAEAQAEEAVVDCTSKDKTACGDDDACEWVEETTKDLTAKTSIPISITAEYGYYKDQTLSLTAVGK